LARSGDRTRRGARPPRARVGRGGHAAEGRARGRSSREPDGEDPRSVGSLVRRALIQVSAVFAAGVVAALLANYLIMPMLVRRGDLTTAPSVVGVPLLEAQRLAERAGLKLRVDDERPEADVPVGSVAFQTPDPGSEIKRGRTVAVILSSGVDMRVVPGLSGLNERQAQLDAEHAGFAIVEVAEVHTDLVERGRVIGSDPDGGAVRQLGTGIRLLVSLGARPVELIMPSLIGKTAEEARLIVEGLGLILSSVKYERGRGRGSLETVVVQDPVAGSHVVEGEGVTLRIGR
jgi:beta-lactam-binding protein with PASTA domain